MTTLNPSGSRLWSVPYVLLILSSLVISITQMMISTTLPVFILNQGGSKSAAGLIAGLFSLAALVTRPLFGHLLDRLSRSLVLLIGCLIFLAGTVPVYFLHSVSWLLILRVVQGFGFSAITTASGTMVADLVSHDLLANAIGFFSLAGTAAGAIGPLLGIFLIDAYDYPILFLAMAVLAMAGLGVSLLIRDPVRPEQAPGPAWSGQPGEEPETARSGEHKPFTDSRYPFPGSFLEKTAIPPALVMLFLAASYGGLVSFLPAFAQSRGISGVGLFFTVYAGTIIVIRLLLGSLATRMNNNRLIILACLLMLAGMLVLTQARSLLLIVLVAVLYGLGFGIVYPLINTLVMQLCPPPRRGRANATFFVAMDLGIGLGSILLGFLSQASSLAAVFYACAIIIVLAMIVHQLVLRQHVTG